MSSSKAKTKDKARMVKTGRGGLQGIRPALSFKPDHTTDLQHRRDDISAPHGRELNPSTKITPRQDVDTVHLSRVGRGGDGNLQRYFPQPGLFERVMTHERGRVQARRDDPNTQAPAVDKTGRGGLGNMHCTGISPRLSVEGTRRLSMASVKRPSSSTSRQSMHRPSSSFSTLVEPSTSIVSPHHRHSSSLSTLVNPPDAGNFNGTTHLTKNSGVFGKFKRFLKRETFGTDVEGKCTVILDGDEEFLMVPTPGDMAVSAFSLTSSDSPARADARPTLPAPSLMAQKTQRPRPILTTPKDFDLANTEPHNLVAFTSSTFSPKYAFDVSPYPTPSTLQTTKTLPTTYHLLPQVGLDPPHRVSSPDVPRSPSPPSSAIASSECAVWGQINEPASPDPSHRFVLRTKASSVLLPLSSAPTSPNVISADSHFSRSPVPSSSFSIPNTRPRPMRSASMPGGSPRQCMRSTSRSNSPHSPLCVKRLVCLSLNADREHSSPPQSPVMLMEGYYNSSPTDGSKLFSLSAIQPQLAEPPPSLSMSEDWLSTPFTCRFSRSTSTAHGYEGEDKAHMEDDLIDEVDVMLRDLILKRLTSRCALPAAGKWADVPDTPTNDGSIEDGAHWCLKSS